MKTNLTLLSQIINSLNRDSFNKIVKKHESDKHSKGINSWTHFVSMLFCHTAKANSIREITQGLRSMEGNLNHLGIMKKVPSKSSMSYINAHREWEVFRDYYLELHNIFMSKSNFKNEEPETRKSYEKKLRMITVYDEKNKTTMYILTNNFNWTAQTISELYRQRWQIEIFFRDLKSLFKIKTFIGTSLNAVMIQIWTALITMLILKYLKQISQYSWSLSNLIAFIRMNLFVKISLMEWLNHPFKRWEELEEELNPQLKLF